MCSYSHTRTVFFKLGKFFTQESFQHKKFLTPKVLTRKFELLQVEHFRLEPSRWSRKAEPQAEPQAPPLWGFRYLWSHLRKSWGMSCIVSERGTRVSKPIFHVFCTRKIFFHFLGIIASLASARSREIPEKSHRWKKWFFDFSELHQVPYGTPKMTPKNSKMIELSTHNIFSAHF